jgi:hypothetical protein
LNNKQYQFFGATMKNTAIFDGTADKWESLYDRCSMQTSHVLETCYWPMGGDQKTNICPF